MCIEGLLCASAVLEAGNGAGDRTGNSQASGSLYSLPETAIEGVDQTRRYADIVTGAMKEEDGVLAGRAQVGHFHSDGQGRLPSEGALEGDLKCRRCLLGRRAEQAQARGVSGDRAWHGQGTERWPVWLQPDG